ncbi:hypothetical protein TSUD_283760 [Trifolium subterraneum]|uniref:RNase H type-1 domain-containing protein n=1 Tax=Trifolium subterraneum TaxID=3900 RepID=A0A2Z6PNJ6_TRISU|nr:hypothetical protein TSUD_283760 [Trifolium subterraneum]
MSKCGRGSSGKAWCDYWATACHCLWTWRNKETHDADFSRPTHPVQQVYRRVDDYYQAIITNRIMRNTTSMLTYISWKPPSGNFVKLNTDGASKDLSRAGCGGIIRGSQGEWLGGFAKGLGSCSAVIAELWGVAEGLSYAKRLGFTAVELNVDSIVVAQAVKSGNSNSPVGLPLVKHIRRVLNSDWEIKVEHAYRESNKCADAMANVGCQLDREIIFYDSCPTPLYSTGPPSAQELLCSRDAIAAETMLQPYTHYSTALRKNQKLAFLVLKLLNHLPTSSYDNLQPSSEDYAKEPPLVPPHFAMTLLNVRTTNMEIQPPMPRPQHGVLNTLYMQKEMSSTSSNSSGCPWYYNSPSSMSSKIMQVFLRVLG